MLPLRPGGLKDRETSETITTSFSRFWAIRMFAHLDALYRGGGLATEQREGEGP